MRVSTNKLEPLAVARVASKLKQSDMAKKLGCTIQTIVNYEKCPADRLTLETIGKYYHAVDPFGKAVIERYINDFFVA